MLSTTIGLDTATIRDLVRRIEPHVSAYLGLQSPSETTTDTDEDLALRWRALADRLAELGADEATIMAIGTHIRELPVFPTDYAIIASSGAIRLAQELPGGPHIDRARYGTPADVVPLLAWLQHHPPYVAVAVDRAGADVTVVRRGMPRGTTSVVTGPDDVIERNAPGGWAQARYQRRAEDSWHHNAGAVAAAATQALDEIGGRLLLISGDVRAVGYLHDHLIKNNRRDLELRDLPGGRGTDGSEKVRQDAIEQAVADYTDGKTSALLDRFAAEWRPGGTAVDGVAATLSALAEGRASTLLVVDDPTDERVAWFSEDVYCSQFSESEHGPLPLVGRLADVAVRAALLTGADVHVLPPESGGALGERIGALCRYNPTEPALPETVE